MEYKFRVIEKKWQEYWRKEGVYKVSNDLSGPKCYVLDMFPYPSGTGLHVGHPLGYIASDIYSRYKKLKGFNVLHPMGFDSFGLPAEQYALETGQHPAETTKKNIATFKSQLNNIGFSYDWSREVQTSDPQYYKWTQWIFLQLFNSYFCHTEKKALPISLLIKKYETKGAMPKTGEPVPGKHFTATQWNAYSEKEKADILMRRRLAYCGFGEVNWCEALGTVLANDEVINGLSERGGHPVVKKTLRQWYLRITEYADRLLEGLETVDFSEAMKEMQSNWIGKSTGAEIDFRLTPNPSPHGEGGEQPSGKFFQTSDKKSWAILKEFGRENRKNKTEGENIIWQQVRNQQLGAKARRQHAIGEYIVDFVFMELKLVIEIDGDYHDEEEQKRYDTARTDYLNEFGFEVIRFQNDEVITNTDSVIASIQKAIEKKRNTNTSGPIPLLREEKGLGDEAASEMEKELGDEMVIRVYTTRPDTIFGVDFIVLAPEHDLVLKISTEEHQAAVEEYIAYVNSRSERERMAEKKITGVFTGAYCIHPYSKREIPIWVSEYVLIGYGTGAIMAVPCGDERDHKFAMHFSIPITNIIGEHYQGEIANPTKDAVLQHSGFLDGMIMREAIDFIAEKMEKEKIGVRKVHYKMHDAAFSRQRYWGEPFPITWKDGTAYAIDEKELPLLLPHVDTYKPGPEGEGPLANIKEWVDAKLETNTMPGYAGSSWYFLRYMDPWNEKEFCDRKFSDYWGQVDLYIGGTEHAVGHLLYSRMWTKCLYDLGLIGFDEPYKKLVNQGMILGSSRFVYRVHGKNLYVSAGLKDQYPTDAIHTDVNIVDGLVLDIEAFKNLRDDHAHAEFILEDGKYLCGSEVEKMSKSKFNTVNPDVIVEKYGADTFRMYEMFLGPVEMSKPWDTKGIEGVYRFLKKLWRLFVDETKGFIVNEEKVSPEELKVLHHAIRKIGQDTEKFSFNTAVSAFMIATNELTDLKCHKREILEPLLILLSPYAPHISEELWQMLGNKTSITRAGYPVFREEHVKESEMLYPVAINGKTRTELKLSLEASQQQVEEMVLDNDIVKKWLEGKAPKKVIYVKNKMINVVV